MINTLDTKEKSMNINRPYKNAYATWKSLWWVDNRFLGDSLAVARIKGKFADAWREKLEEEYFATYPRRSKPPTDEQLLELERFDEIQEAWRDKGIRWYAQKIKQKGLLWDYLVGNARNVSMESASWHATYSQKTSTYSTQTSKVRMARGDCERKGRILDQAGIPHVIEPYGLNEEYCKYYRPPFAWASTFKRGLGAYHKKISGYTLFSPLEPYQLFALELSGDKSELEWAVEVWGTGGNPKVINPWLDDSVFEKSMQIHMQGE